METVVVHAAVKFVRTTLKHARTAGITSARRRREQRPDSSVVAVILSVALRCRSLETASGIHLGAAGANFDHRRRGPTEVTVRRLDGKSWQLVWAVLAWEHARVAESMCARCYISGSIGYRQ